MSVPRARLLELMQAQCKVFSTTFNPDRTRLGNKVLRQRLRGPAMAAYYPRKVYTTGDLIKEFKPLQLLVDNEAEEDRLELIAGLKARGKSAPKKKRTAPESTKRK
ncbi:hypothetical protein GQ53DRAFT_749299 [Thozetella sp. PMI_491]|nr:hypothetical protein GQ53DRAFT_749299 [Thozetella sp. PMI_491]